MEGFVRVLLSPAAALTLSVNKNVFFVKCLMFMFCQLLLILRTALAICIVQRNCTRITTVCLKHVSFGEIVLLAVRTYKDSTERRF